MAWLVADICRFGPCSLLVKRRYSSSLLFAGLIALVTAQSYVKLSITYPDRGGTVRFINQGFGKTVFSGGINNLLWVSYVIMLSLYASAFGSYAPNLLSISDKTTDFHIYASLIIVLATAINYYSIKVVGQIESYAVVIKLAILLSLFSLVFMDLSAIQTCRNWRSQTGKHRYIC